MLFSLKKGNPAIDDKMNEAGGYCAKCNRPDTERQCELIPIESRMEAARGWEEAGREGCQAKGTNFQFQDE